MVCEFYDVSGRMVDEGQFSLISKSIYRATIDAQMITGMKVSLFSSKFSVLADGDKRAVIGHEKH